MTQPFISLDGVRARSVRLLVPWTGVPVAALAFDDEVILPTASATLAIGDISITGVVDPSQSGDYALDTSATFIAGGGGWGKKLTKRAYHNDAGVLFSSVASDAAAEVGETIVIDPSLDGSTGVDYARLADVASHLLDGMFPDAAWWVETDGVTHVGTRTLRDVTTKVELLDADPRLRTAVLVADDARDLLPGCFFTDDRLGTFTIHDLDLVVAGGQLRAYVTESEQRDGRLLSLLSELVRRTRPRAPLERGPYRYRVVSMASDRVNLQAVNDKLDLPDPLPVGMSAGIAGCKAQLQPGAIVLVDFLEGDPELPLVTHYTRPDEPGFLPVSLTIDCQGALSLGSGASSVQLGGNDAAGAPVAVIPGRVVRYGDMITFGSPGSTAAITYTGAAPISKVSG